MDDLISRQAAIDALNEYFARIGKLKRKGLTKGEKAISLDTVGTIATLPSTEPERKKGKWKVWGIQDYAQRPTGRYVGECPFCGYLTGEFMRLPESGHELTNFCSNCGADMRGN